MGRNVFHQIRLLRVPSNPTLNIFRAEVFTALGNLFNCLITLTVKIFFLMSNLNLPFFSLKLLPLFYYYRPCLIVPNFLISPF